MAPAGCRCLEKGWLYGCAHNFEHDHYNMGVFPCKSQCRASLRNLCANLVPMWKCWIIMAKSVEIKEKNRYNVKETGK